VNNTEPTQLNRQLNSTWSKPDPTFRSTNQTRQQEKEQERIAGMPHEAFKDTTQMKVSSFVLGN